MLEAVGTQVFTANSFSFSLFENVYNKMLWGGGNISSKISAQRPVFGDTGRTLLCCDQQEVVSTWNARVFLESRCHARHHGLDDAGRAASF